MPKDWLGSKVRKYFVHDLFNVGLSVYKLVESILEKIAQRRLKKINGAFYKFLV
jgi:hypothetical protein